MVSLLSNVMLRILTILAFMATLGMVGVVYKLKYETRELQLEAAKLRSQIIDERGQVAVLKAEWSMVTQPRQVEKLAKNLGLSALKAPQIITNKDIDSFPLNQEFNEARVNSEDELSKKSFAVRQLAEVDNVNK